MFLIKQEVTTETQEGESEQLFRQMPEEMNEQHNHGFVIHQYY